MHFPGYFVKQIGCFLANQVIIGGSVIFVDESVFVEDQVFLSEERVFIEGSVFIEDPFFFKEMGVPCQESPVRRKYGSYTALTALLFIGGFFRILFIFDKENFIDPRSEIVSDTCCKEEGWVVLPVLESQDRLSGNADRPGKFFLGDIVHRTEDFDTVVHILAAPDFLPE
jgi:hypothetical protein